MSGGAVGDRHGRPCSSADALARSLEEVHKARGRSLGSINLVLGTDNSEEAWRRVDKKVNSYPAQRSFTAIGVGGSSFQNAMVDVVSSVVGSVHQECVSNRSSTRGSYISVTIGPVWVRNADEVIAVYSLMRNDDRLKWYL